MADNGLTLSQQRKLTSLEQQIAKGASDLYQALRQIHDEKLYRGAHQTFEAYCIERWGMSARHAQRLLQHGQVLRLVEEEIGPIGPKILESHTRELADLPPEEAAKIIADTVEKTGGKPTAKAIRETRSGDPFGESTEEDPFGEGDSSETDVAGKDAQQDEELPPRTPGSGTEAPGGPSKRTPLEEFKLQRSKTKKTAEALMRAFSDLNKLRKSAEHEPAIDGCKALLHKVQNW